MPTPPQYHQVLEHLPATGPMYIPVSKDGQPFYSQDYTIRFFPKSGDSWVGNFKSGLGDFEGTFEFTEHYRVLVIAGGQVYLMSPEEHTPLGCFGGAINEILPYEENSLICLDGTEVEILNDQGLVWRSPRISGDGMKDIGLEDHILSGLSWTPLDETKEWVPFRINLRTKEIEGGSYRESFPDDGLKRGRKKWWFW